MLTLWASSWGKDVEAQAVPTFALSIQLQPALHVVQLKQQRLGEAQQGALADPGDVAPACVRLIILSARHVVASPLHL